MSGEQPTPADLLAHARHELRTPVNALIGYSEMLLEDGPPDDPAVCAGLRRLLELGRKAQGLIGEALGAARLEGGVPLEALADDVRARLSPPAREAVAVSADLVRQPGLAPLAADLGRLHTAANNLLRMLDDPFPGAARPAPAPGPVSAGAQERDITDFDELERVFSALRGHALVVDDNPFNRDMLARGLHRQGHAFALARNGKEALDALDGGRFDLVLLDILMPEMDGFEVLRRVKAEPRWRDIPVIMISALDQIDAVVRCIEMGAEDYLPKPFDPVLLRARVGACLEKKRLRDQELEYLRNVALVTEAAASVEAGAFDPAGLDAVAGRDDALGRLARVFQSMAREVRARQEKLEQEVHELRIEIDLARRDRQVAEVTDNDYFQQLQDKAHSLRQRRRSAGRAPEGA